MPTVSALLRTIDLRRVGTCQTCMRISFIMMLASWAISLAATSANLKVSQFICGISIVFTLLWLSHVFTRARRSIYFDGNHDGTRRAALRTFGKAVLGAAVTSASLLMSEKARADSGCGGWSGGGGCSHGCGRCQRQDSNCNCSSNDRGCGDGC